MLKLNAFIKKGLTFSEKIQIINQWEEWRGAFNCESIFDLQNEKDCKDFVHYYGAQTLSRCKYSGHRYWMGGENFYDNVENKEMGCSAQIYAVTDEIATDIISKIVISELEDSFMQLVIEYNYNVKSAVEHISSCFNYLIDFASYAKVVFPCSNKKIIRMCGRNWECRETNPVTQDEKWWHVSTFSDGKLYMNNVDGEMVLIEPSGRILYTYF
jgi:hypothetical protein